MRVPTVLIGDPLGGFGRVKLGDEVAETGDLCLPLSEPAGRWPCGYVACAQSERREPDDPTVRRLRNGWHRGGS